MHRLLGSHDLNNLLGAVLDNLELLKKRLQAPDPEVQRLVDSAIHEARLATSLTNQILTGGGMDEPMLQRSYDPFCSTKDVGNGAGLSMVRDLTDRSGGKFKLSSSAGEETVAEVRLPITEATIEDAKLASTVVTMPNRPGRLPVMIVDDDPLVLGSIAALLDDLGYAVIEAKSAEEALDLIRYTEVDLVITDYAMPGMNGLQLIEAIAAERPGTSVLLCTGCTDLPLDMRSWLPKISKPFDQATLVSAIEDATRGPSVATPAVADTVVPFRPRAR